MGSRTAVPVFELAAFDLDGENMWESVGGRAGGRMRQPFATGRLLLSLSSPAGRGLRSTAGRKKVVLMPGMVASSCTALPGALRPECYN